MFNFIVVIHEWGHYITAKKNGVLIHEFAVGMGPKLWHFIRGETIYSIRIFPIGGFCSLEEELDTKTTNPRAMGAKKAWQRLMIVSAGAIMNFLTAWFLLSLISGYMGYGNNVIDTVEEGMPVAQAGLVKGDQIIAIDGNKVKTLKDISVHLDNTEKTYRFTIKRENNEVLDKDITSQWVEEEERARLGFTPEIVHWNLGYNVKTGFLNTFYVIREVWSGVISLFTGSVSVNEMSGIIGVVDFSAKQWDTGLQNGGIGLALMNMIYITALLSANLGVINLLPLPALDGGRILFILVELLRGKPLAADKEAAVHFVGFVLLMLLTVVVLYNDVMKVFNI